MIKRLCVFCGSNPGKNSAYVEAAQQVGRLLAERQIELIYGGGKVGLMGAVANASLQHGGRVVGVIPQSLVDKEIAHQGLSQLHVVGSMHERKALMADLADGFLALPGGYGTWDEFCEILTWAQLGLHHKPSALLNVNAYYDPFLAMADHAAEEGFLRQEHRAFLLCDTDPVRLLDRMGSYAVPMVDKMVDKWIDRADL